jgi:hypothetical protein
MLLIPECSASSPMPPIGTGIVSGSDPQYRTHRLNLSLNTKIHNTSEASEVASIEDTRQKELFYLQTSPSLSVVLFQ